MATKMGSEKALLEKKVGLLEHRLSLVERFVEMRFCETFRDFTSRHPAVFTQSPYEKQRSTKEPSRRNAVQRDFEDKEDFLEHVSSPPSPQHEDQGSDDSDHDSSDDNRLKSVTTYRTRSGRKATRLITTSPLKKAGSEVRPSTSTAKPVAGSKIKDETPISEKVLRVSLRKIEKEQQQSLSAPGSTTTASGRNRNTTVFPVDKDSDSDSSVLNSVGVKTQANYDAESGDDDFFTFPSGEQEAEDPLAVPDGGDGGDSEWNPSAGEDNDNNPQSSGKRKLKAKTSVRARRGPEYYRKYSMNTSIRQLPEGVSLQMVKGDATTGDLKECPVCRYHVKPENYDQHMKRHVTERHLKCSKCDLRFYSPVTLRSHERRHNHKFDKKCRLCDKGFDSVTKVLSHERMCIRKRLEKGEAVDPEIMENVRERSTPEELKWPDPNERVPEGMKKCIHCKEFVEESVMLKHLSEKHANWKCELCENVFVYKAGLVRHLVRTHGSHTFTCDLCEKKFARKYLLQRHKKMCGKGLEVKEEVEQGLDEGEGIVEVMQVDNVAGVSGHVVEMQ